MKVLLFHPGTQYAHQLACQLTRLGSLYKFITGIGFTSSDIIPNILPQFGRRRISNRILDCSMSSIQLKSIPLPELVALYKLYRGFNPEEVLFERNRAFQERISFKHIKKAECFVGFDTSSWLFAEKVKKFDKPFILDQSIAHPKEKIKIFASLRIEYPEWADETREKKPAFIALEGKEHRLSNKIVVASTFTRDSLVKNMVPPEKIVVNPYGVGPNFFRNKTQAKRGEKTRFIYLGLLGARKGLPLLLETWQEYELFEHAELWIAGPASNLALRTIKNIRGVYYKGKVPFREIPQLLDTCNCLVFPSFFEGFGQVILEAMAAGLPVITTEATAGPDIIEHAKDGFIIRPGDKHALSQHMISVATDPGLCYYMGTLAREKARSFSWNAYGDRWNNILKSI